MLLKLFMGVGLGYGWQLHFHICVFENPPQFQASLQHRLFTLDMGSLKKKEPFSFYLSIAVLLVFLYLIAANKSVLVLYACAHKISLKYLFPEKIAIEICCQNCQECKHILCDNLFFLWISRVCQIKNIKYIHQNFRIFLET